MQCFIPWAGMPSAYQQKMPRSNGKSNPVFGQTAISLRCEVSWAAWVYRLIGIVRWQRATAITTAGRNGCFWKCMPAALRIKKMPLSIGIPSIKRCLRMSKWMRMAAPGVLVRWWKSGTCVSGFYASLITPMPCLMILMNYKVGLNGFAPCKPIGLADLLVQRSISKWRPIQARPSPFLQRDQTHYLE